MNKYLLTGLFFLVQFYTIAQNVFNPSSGNWNLASNWSLNVIPSSGSAISIPAGRTVTIPNGYTAQSANITLDGTITAGSTNSGNLTVSGNITGTGSIIMGTGNLSITGNFSNTVNFTPNTSTVIYNRTSGNQTVRNGSYYRLTKSGAGIATANGNISISNNFSITSGTLIILSGFTSGAASVTGGNLNIETSSTVTMNSLIMSGGMLNLGNSTTTIVNFPLVTNAVTLNGGTVRYNSNGSQNIRTTTYSNLQLSAGGSKTLLNNITINGSFLVDNGPTLDAGIYSITALSGLTNNGIVAFTSGTLTVTGNLENAGEISFTTGNLTVNGNYGSNGSLSFESGNFTISGDYNNGGIFTSGSGIVTYNGSGGTQRVGGVSYHNLTFSGTSERSLQDQYITIGNTFLVSGQVITNGSVVNFSGVNQAIPSLNYENLYLSGSGEVTIAGDVKVISGLEFQSEILLNTSSNNLTIGIDGYISGTNDQAHIIGILRREASSGSQKDFPIGNGSVLLNVSIIVNEAIVSEGDYLEVGFTPCAPLSSCFADLNLAYTDPAKVVNRYWTITNGGFEDLEYDASVTYLSDDYTNVDPAKLQFKAFNRATSLYEPVTTASNGPTNAMASGISIPDDGNTIDLLLGEGSPSKCISTGDGLWTSPSTWSACGDGIPDGLDTVVISSGHTITMDGNSGNAYSLLIEGTADWINSNETNVSLGGIVLSAGGDITGDFPGVLRTSGNFETNRSTFSSPGVIIEFANGPSQELLTSSALSSFTINKLNINSNVLNSLPSLIVSTQLEGTSLLSQNTGTALVVSSGSPSISMPFIDASLGSSVTYDRDDVQTIIPGTYNNLVITTSGTSTITKSFMDGNFYEVLVDLSILNNTGTISLDLTSAILNIGGQINGTGELITSGGSTINYNAASGTQLVSNMSYYNIQFSNEALKVIPATITVEGDISNFGSPVDAITNNSNVILSGSLTQTLTGNNSFYNLTKSGTSTVNVPTGEQIISNLLNITGSGEIMSNGNITIAHGATLIDQNLTSSFPEGPTGYVRVLKNTAASARSYFLSGPVSPYTSTDLNASQSAHVLYFDTDGIPMDWNKKYSNLTSCGGPGQMGSLNGLYKRVAGTLSVARGYSVAQAGAKTINFLGNVNHGDITINPISQVDRTIPDASGFRWCDATNGIALLGNPYPSPIDWAAVHNGSTQLNTSAKVWNGTNYTDINANDPVLENRTIYSGQAFLVQLTSDFGDGGSITFSNSQRVSGVTNTLRREQNLNPNKLSVSITNSDNSNYKDELVLRFAENAIEGLNINLDSYDLPGILEVPSLTAFYDANKFSTKVLPILNDRLIVPLSLVIGEKGTYGVSLANFENIDFDGEVYLTDKLSKTEYNLTKEQVNLNLDKSTYNHYELQFRKAELDSENSGSSMTNEFNAYVSDGKINVEYLGNEPANIDIIDISGRVIASKKEASSGTYEFFIKNKGSQFYMIKLSNSNIVNTKKVILN